MPSYRLISFVSCPFVQRAAFLLQAKSVDYEIEYIDLADKPDWFLALSPLGRVPLLEVDGETVLFESQVIAEYLDESHAPRMHPESPLERAKHRAVIELVSAALGPAWRLTTAESEEEFKAVAVTLRKLLARLEDAHAGNMFFGGHTLCLVDAAAAPLLQRVGWADEVSGHGLVAGFPRLAAWRDALVRDPTLAASAVPDLRERVLATYKGWLGTRVSA